MSSVNLQFSSDPTKPSTQKQKQTGIKFRGDTIFRQTKSSGKQTLRERELLQKEERKNLTLLKHPISVVVLFSDVVKEYVFSLMSQIKDTPIAMMILIPILLIIALHFLRPILGVIVLNELFYLHIEWILWWLILGILSSIGLGTGMHSGLLFLFPFIGNVCMTAATCHSLEFDTFGDHAFICNETHDESSSTVTFWALFFKVFTPCFLWGSGTAIGEIPPYALSLARVRAGKQDEFAEMQEELTLHAGSRFFNRMKLWMIEFLEKYGFWAVLAFAAWPNMAFDMCGIACGHFEMEFWTFFGATFIGKALIKINLQSLFFVTMFNENALNKLIDRCEHFGFQYIADAATDFFETQRNIILGKIDKDEIENKSVPIFTILWSIIVSAFILMFVASTIQIFAQQKLKEIHEKQNERWTKSKQNQIK